MSSQGNSAWRIYCLIFGVIDPFTTNPQPGKYMQKTIEIMIESNAHRQTMTPSDAEELDMRMKAFEIAVRMNPSLLEDFINLPEPIHMASPKRSVSSRDTE